MPNSAVSKREAAFVALGTDAREWRWTGAVLDLDPLNSPKCELCGAGLRYGHPIAHPSGRTLVIGVECLGNYLDPAEAGRAKRETARRKKAAQAVVVAMAELSEAGKMVEDLLGLSRPDVYFRGGKLEDRSLETPGWLPGAIERNLHRIVANKYSLTLDGVRVEAPLLLRLKSEEARLCRFASCSPTREMDPHFHFKPLAR